MHRRSRFLLGTLALFALVHSAAYSGEGGGFFGSSRRGSVFVVPRRYTMVQVGFDVIYLRPAVMVCYEVVKGRDQPVLNVWDAASASWRRMSLGHYQSGGFLAFSPKQAIIVGTDEGLPASISDYTSWAGTTHIIKDVSVAGVMNELSEYLDFSGREWEWLAQRYKLKLRDLNYRRRLYGRYGPPDISKAAPPLNVPAESTPRMAGEEELAPAPVMEPATKAEALPGMAKPEPIEEEIKAAPGQRGN